jgi:phosphoserine/homoserine phosphotransferase
MFIVCCDLEGVFVPEIWINVAERTGIEALRLTTRDIADYDKLMRHRLEIMAAHNLKLTEIQAAIAAMTPLPGADGFLRWLRSVTQVIILSDTFQEFAGPLMEKLGWPTLMCHELIVDADDNITGYRLRLTDAKKRALLALQDLNYHTIGVGDSYNDIEMLKAADTGILFSPPENVVEEFPDLPVTQTYDELQQRIAAILGVALETPAQSVRIHHPHDHT